MIYLEKSQPAPECLEKEKAKANGNYRCGNVLEKLKKDFKNKCYICEFKEPSSINVEHHIPHQNNKDLKFNWDNLFWSCYHCNHIKSNKFQNILNCTVKTDNVETDLKYIFEPLPFEIVSIEVLKDEERVRNTRELLLAVYNGNTPQKIIESNNLREKLRDEIIDFRKYLVDYFKDIYSDEDKEYFLIRIKGHLNKASYFTAFKRWIIRKNEQLYKEFGQYLD